ncbi:hypothetical protein EJV47_08445 [Hymenobacter gummosus]|uniref:Uncharacterized protein n=1 Tax=Hymenobacter gummosus TaxID=1776032 RepID=A0A3S0JB50_9BACT|nr:hypothetical protein [Hymenobacter gummosus]RTQ50653.1 hypothetical protein EJV47_08445 [Hymenobacter gummosus]
MASADNLQFQLSAAELQRLHDALDIVDEVLGSKLITLSGKDIQRLPKASDGTLPFIEKSLDLAEQQPKFAPAYIDIPGLRLDLDAYRLLSRLSQRLRPLADNLNATTIKAGSEAYVAALAYYNSAQQALRQNVSGAQAVVDELKNRFESSSQRKADKPKP